MVFLRLTLQGSRGVTLVNQARSLAGLANSTDWGAFRKLGQTFNLILKELASLDK